MRVRPSFPTDSACIGRSQPKILVIAEDPWARDTTRVLLGSMGCHCVMASSMPRPPALGQENPDAAIVDAQCKPSATSLGFSGLDEICFSLRGRVIVLTGEGHDPEVDALIQRFGLVSICRESLFQDLWGALNGLLRANFGFRRIIHAARLIFDSFLESAPVGMRNSQVAARRFVYEAGSLMVDLSLEPPQTDSRRMSLVGQLMDSAKPHRQLDILSVALQGPEGPIALASANKFAEFRFEFDLEQDIKLEIETGARDCISIVLPNLEWAEKRAAGAV